LADEYYPVEKATIILIRKNAAGNRVKKFQDSMEIG